jgi:hypothetical protein
MAHEDLTRQERVERSSDRSFGVVIGCVLAYVALGPLLHRGQPRWWALPLSVGLLTVAWLRPFLLAGPNRLWGKFGDLLSKALSPIALGVMFYLVFTPMGVLIRLAGKDPLRLRREPALRSYWIAREPPGPPPQSMTNQF